MSTKGRKQTVAEALAGDSKVGAEPAKKQAGEIWKIDHSRKGLLTVKLLQDVPAKPGDDDWVAVEVLDGRVRWASEENKMHARVREMETGHPDRGTGLTVRLSLVRFLERLPE